MGTGRPAVWQPLAVPAAFLTTSNPKTNPPTLPAGHPISGDVVVDTRHEQTFVHDGTDWHRAGRFADPVINNLTGAQTPPSINNPNPGDLAVRDDGAVWLTPDGSVWNQIVSPAQTTVVTVTGQDPTTAPPTGTPRPGDMYSTRRTTTVSGATARREHGCSSA